MRALKVITLIFFSNHYNHDGKAGSGRSDRVFSFHFIAGQVVLCVVPVKVGFGHHSSGKDPIQPNMTAIQPLPSISLSAAVVKH